MTAPDGSAVRARLLSEKTSRFYHGYLHLAYNAGVSLGLACYAACRVVQPQPWEWALIPVVLLGANHVEYAIHRFVMHRRRSSVAMRRLYRGHHEEHHRFYIPTSMAAAGHRDFALILYPPVLGVWIFLIGCMAMPWAVLLGTLISPNAGWIALATILVYFQLYELLEFSYHALPDSRLRRLPYVSWMYQNHLQHHHFMTRCNFNVTLPLCDVLYGTYRPPVA